jgi:hypothetical protein
MPKVLFTISYSVKPEKREAYLQHMSQLREHLRSVAKKNYTLFEAKGKKGQFTEVFESDSIEEFDAMEDNYAPETEALIAKVEEFVDDKGMKYSSMVEVG